MSEIEKVGYICFQRKIAEMTFKVDQDYWRWHNSIGQYKLSECCAIRQCKNIAEKFKSLPSGQQRYRQTTDRRQTDDSAEKQCIGRQSRIFFIFSLYSTPVLAYASELMRDLTLQKSSHIGQCVFLLLM